MSYVKKRFISVIFIFCFIFLFNASVNADLIAKFKAIKNPTFGQVDYFITNLPDISPEEFVSISKRTEWFGLKSPTLHRDLFKKMKGCFTPKQALWAMIYCKHDESCYKIIKKTKGKFSYFLYNFYNFTQRRPGLKELRKMVAKKTYFISYEESSIYAYLNENEFDTAWILVGKHCNVTYACITTNSFSKNVLIDSDSRPPTFSKKKLKKLTKKYANIRLWYLGEEYPYLKEPRTIIIKGRLYGICPAGKDYCKQCGYIGDTTTFRSNFRCPNHKCPDPESWDKTN